MRCEKAASGHRQTEESVWGFFVASLISGIRSSFTSQKSANSPTASPGLPIRIISSLPSKEGTKG
jgi:hypothetical protein